MVRFSIVIPTLNRAGLLQHSLPTALEQTFDDYEVVVSNNASTDETEEVVSGFSSDRLRVVRPETRLSMVDHWEFAVRQSAGEWILLLCDDDALLPSCLATLDAVIRDAGDCRLIQYDRFRYVYGDGIEAEGNYVEVGDRVLSGLRTMESSRRLGSVFWRLSLELPKLLNATAHRSLLDELRSSYGRVFGIWAPDIWIGVKLLEHTRTYLKTGPLMLWGETMQSYGSGARRDPEHMLRFFRQFPEFEGTLPHSPYGDLLTVTNCVYDTLYRLKQESSGSLAHLEVDPVRYRRKMLEDVERYIERGHSEYESRRERIRRDLRRQRVDPRHGWKKIVARAATLPEKLTKVVGGRKSSGPKRRHRFGNIHEAARFVGMLGK